MGGKLRELAFSLSTRCLPLFVLSETIQNISTSSCEDVLLKSFGIQSRSMGHFLKGSLETKTVLAKDKF